MHIGNNLIVTLQKMINQYNTKDDVDYIIAEYLLKNLRREDLSIQTIAEECHISKASVSRFTQRLGYEGFTDFKINFDSLGLGIDEMKMDLLALNKKNNPSDTQYTQLLIEEFDQVGKDLLKFNQEIDFKKIEDLCRLIHDSNNIHIFATQIPVDMGNILQRFILNAGKFVTCYHSAYDQYVVSQNLEENDLVIFLSLEGSHVMKRELTLSVANSVAISVLITQNPAMKLGSLFDHIVPLGEHSLERSGKYKLLMFVEYLAHTYFNIYS